MVSAGEEIEVEEEAEDVAAEVVGGEGHEHGEAYLMNLRSLIARRLVTGRKKLGSRITSASWESIKVGFSSSYT